MNELREKVKAAVAAWLQAGSNRSANQLAKLAKVSAATITNLLNKPDVTIVEKTLMKISRAIGLRLVEDKHWEFNDGKYKDNYTKIKLIMEEAARSKTDFWIDAPSGSGKTHAFTMLRDKNKGIDGATQVAYIELKQGMSNAYICQQLLSEYYTDRQLNKLPKQAGKLRALLAEKLMEHAHVLVIDQVEFGMMTGKLKFLHGLWDLLQGEVAVIFCGAHTLPIIAKKGLEQSKNYYNQIATRFENGFRILDGIDAELITRVCRHEGITNQSAIDWFIYHCKHFRMLKAKVNKALEYVESKGKKASELTENQLNGMNRAAIKTREKLELC